MQNTHPDTEIKDLYPSSLDAENFIPIDLNWRKKYYGRVLKKRAFALLLDIIIIYLFLVVILITVYLSLGDMFYDVSKMEKIDSIVIVSSSFLCAVCIALMESSKRKGTFGKRIMKIEITDNYGNPISFWRSLWRNILKLLTFYSYCFYGIGLIIQIFTYVKTKKLFHDHFSKTIIGERL